MIDWVSHMTWSFIGLAHYSHSSMVGCQASVPGMKSRALETVEGPDREWIGDMVSSCDESSD
jgi:hypothetical protein